MTNKKQEIPTLFDEDAHTFYPEELEKLLCSIYHFNHDKYRLYIRPYLKSQKGYFEINDSEAGPILFITNDLLKKMKDFQFLSKLLK